MGVPGKIFDFLPPLQEAAQLEAAQGAQSEQN